MINILIVTDNIQDWIDYLGSSIKFSGFGSGTQEAILENDLFSFRIVKEITEQIQNQVFSHVIEDKYIDHEVFCNLILPSIRQKVTQYGSHTILKTN